MSGGTIGPLRAPDTIDVGPLRYEILESLRQIRVVLEKNDVQPIAFDVVLEGIVPCFTEEREDRRRVTGYRRTADQIRYHQTGTARGWVEVEGVRTEITPDAWIMTRDHSRGVRPGVGQPVADVALEPMDSGQMRVLAIWNPLFFQRADGSTYAFHQYYLYYGLPGFERKRAQGGFERPSARREPLAAIEQHLRFDSRNRRCLEGEYFADCSMPEAVQRLNQFRDCLVQLRDEHTGAIGWGNCQTFITGAWPEMGLPEG